MPRTIPKRPVSSRRPIKTIKKSTKPPRSTKKTTRSTNNPVQNVFGNPNLRNLILKKKTKGAKINHQSNQLRRLIEQHELAQLLLQKIRNESISEEEIQELMNWLNQNPQFIPQFIP
jgi:hypothetical protein